MSKPWDKEPGSPKNQDTSLKPWQVKPDLAEANRFLAMLDPATADFTFATFDDVKSRGDKSLTYGCLHGSLAAHADKLATLNRQRAGVFVMVNAGDGKRRSLSSLIAIRAVWGEFDSGMPSGLPIEPSIIVESSPGKHHCYWLCEDIELFEHRSIMDRLVADWGSDIAARDEPRVLRLPGFYHTKGNPFRVHIIGGNGYRYCRDEIIQAFPPVIAAPKVVRPVQFSGESSDKVEEVRSALRTLSADAYHEWIKVGMALHASMGSTGRSLWDEWSGSSTKYDDRHQDYKWRTFHDDRPNGVTLATVFKMANDTGWRWEEGRKVAGDPEEGRAIAAGLKAGEPEVDVVEEERAEAFAIYQNKFKTLAEHNPEFPERLTYVPGLVGEMIDWIVSSARYPSRISALPAALVTGGTVMGRQWASPTESATHLYALLTAPSGVGKDHPLKCVAALLKAANMEELVAAGRFRSSTSVVNTLTRKALCVSLIDEFGDFLKFIGDHKSGPHAHEIGAMLRELWSNSFDSYRTPEWASRQTDTIEAPSLSLFGVTTPDDFYQSLTERVVGNGLLNRFFAIHLEKKPVETEPCGSRRAPPDHIADALSRLRMPDGFAHGIVTLPGVRANAISPRVIPWGKGAEAVYKAMREHVGAISEEIGTHRVFFGRTCEMALRAATIAAGGMSQSKPVLTAETMEWARDLMLWSHRDMMERTKLYIAETPTAAAVKRVYRTIRANGRKPMTRSELTYALDHAFSPKVREEAIRDLVESGKVVEVRTASGKKGGRPSTKYIAREHYRAPKSASG